MKRHEKRRVTGLVRTTVLIPSEIIETIDAYFPHGAMSRLIVNTLWAVHRLFRSDPSRALEYLSKTQVDTTKLLPVDTLSAIVRTYTVFRTMYGSGRTVGEYLHFLLKLITGGDTSMRLAQLKNIDDISDDELERIIQDEKVRAEFALIVSKHETLRSPDDQIDEQTDEDEQ